MLKTLAAFVAGVFLFSNTIGWAQDEKSSFSTSTLAPVMQSTNGAFVNSFNVLAICEQIEKGARDNPKFSLKDVLARLTQGDNEPAPKKIMTDSAQTLYELLSSYNAIDLLSLDGKELLDVLKRGDVSKSGIGFDIIALRGLSRPRMVEKLMLPKECGGFGKKPFISHKEFAERNPNFVYKVKSRDGSPTPFLRVLIGCENTCLFCAAGGRRPVRSLPYPIIIDTLLQKSTGQEEDEQKYGLIYYTGSEDALHYCDKTCAATITDVVMFDSRYSIFTYGNGFATAGHSPFDPSTQHVQHAIKQLIDYQRAGCEPKKFALSITFHLYRAEIRDAILRKDTSALKEAVSTYYYMYKDLVRCWGSTTYVCNRIDIEPEDLVAPHIIKTIRAIQQRVWFRLRENVKTNDPESQKNINFGPDDYPNSVKWDYGPLAPAEIDLLRRREAEDPAVAAFLDTLDINALVESISEIAGGNRLELPPHTTVLPHEITIELPDDNLAIRYYDPAHASPIAPYSDIAKLETHVINPDHLVRQIIHRVKALSLERQCQAKSTVGSATTALRIVNALYKSSFPDRRGLIREDINIMITYRCPFNCDICLAKDARVEGGTKEMKKTTFFSIIDQLEGFEKIHIVGTGEPLAYGKKQMFEEGLSEDFCEMVKYAAKRIGEVRIVTNGYLIPADLNEARAFFKKLNFPPNVVWLISADRSHEREMSRLMDGKSLPGLIGTLEILREEGVIKTAYNMRIFGGANEEEELEHFGLKLRYQDSSSDFFIGGLLAQGNAEANNLGQPLRIGEIVGHAAIVENFFYYIDPDGKVVPDHFAYMNSQQRKRMGMHSSAIQLDLGNIHDDLLGNLIVGRYMFKNLEIFFRNAHDEIIWNFWVKVDSKFYSTDRTRKMIEAIIFYINGNIDEAQKIMKNLQEEDEVPKTVLAKVTSNIFYYMLSNVSGIEPEVANSFMLDCFGNNYQNIHDGEFIPTMLVALDILNFQKRIRLRYEKITDHYPSMPERWFEDTMSSVHCPVYEAGEVLWYEKERLTSNGFTCVEIAKGKAVGWFRRQYELARAGFGLCPIGVLHDTTADKYFAVEGTSHPHIFFSTAASLKGQIKKIIEQDNGVTRILNGVNNIVELGKFAARLDGASIKINKEHADENCLRVFPDYDEESEEDRACQRWVFIEPEIFENDKSESSMVNAGEAISALLQSLLNEIDLEGKEKISIKQYFDSGYKQEIALKPIGNAEEPSAKGMVFKNQFNYIDTNKVLFQSLLGENKPNTLVRVPVEVLESVGADNINAFLGTFQAAPNGYVELYYMSNVTGAGEVGEEVYTRYGLTKKQLPEDLTPRRRTRTNTITLFATLKGDTVDSTYVKTRLGGFDIDMRDSILIPIGLQHDQAGLIRATILGLKIMDVARKLEANPALAHDQNFKDNDVQARVIQDLLSLYKIEDLKDLKPDDIITLASSGNIPRIIDSLKKLIDLLPIEPISGEALRQIYEHVKAVMVAA